MDYYKKPDTGTPNIYYAVDGTIVYIFNQSVTDETKWDYKYQVLPQTQVNMILVGATAAVRSDLDTPINQIQTILSGL